MRWCSYLKEFIINWSTYCLQLYLQVGETIGNHRIYSIFNHNLSVSLSLDTVGVSPKKRGVNLHNDNNKNKKKNNNNYNKTEILPPGQKDKLLSPSGVKSPWIYPVTSSSAAGGGSIAHKSLINTEDCYTVCFATQN